jgi:hypothetical protein
VRGLRAVALEALPVDERDGNLRAVGRRGVDALGLVLLLVVAAEHGLLLEQRALVRLHVVVVDRARRDEGLVGVAQKVRLELAVDVDEGAVDRLGERQVVRLAGLKIRDAQLLQPAVALGDDVEVLEHVGVFEHHVGAVRDDLLPVLAARV